MDPTLDDLVELVRSQATLEVQRSTMLALKNQLDIVSYIGGLNLDIDCVNTLAMDAGVQCERLAVRWNGLISERDVTRATWSPEAIDQYTQLLGYELGARWRTLRNLP